MLFSHPSAAHSGETQASFQKKIFLLGKGNDSVTLWREGKLKCCMLTNDFSVSGFLGLNS
jgi:hypothetical protein